MNDEEGFGHELVFFDARLEETTIRLAVGSPAVCAFVNDDLGRPVLAELAARGTRLIALRSAGFNNVDLSAARDLGLTVMHVPDYSPYAVAEFTIALILALNRHLSRAYTHVREGNFSLDGLLGFDLHGKTAGIVGTGKIGGIVAETLLSGFGCRVLAYDPFPSDRLRQLGVEYVGLDELLRESDLVSLHCPLTEETHHLIDRRSIAGMKPGVMLINTSRGGLIDTGAVIDGLKSGRIGHLGLDVYEEEARYFYEDYSSRLIDDDALSRLLTFPNVIVTSHQGFFTGRRWSRSRARRSATCATSPRAGRRRTRCGTGRTSATAGAGWRRERLRRAPPLAPAAARQRWLTRYSNAASAALAPSPAATTICLSGTVVQSPAANTPRTPVRPRSSTMISPVSLVSTRSRAKLVLGSRPASTKTASTASRRSSPLSRSAIVRASTSSAPWISTATLSLAGASRAWPSRPCRAGSGRR